MHSVLPLKLCVTKWYQNRVDCRTLALIEMVEFKDFYNHRSLSLTCLLYFY
jgi:hypothetical protein